MSTDRIEAPLTALIGATVTAVETITENEDGGSAVVHFNNGTALYIDSPTVYRSGAGLLALGDRVYVYPSHGLGEAERLQGRRGRITAISPGARFAVELTDGDPRSPFCRTANNVLYLNASEISPERRPA